MNARIPRQSVLGFGPVTLASCTRREPYFGKATPPRSQTLIYDGTFFPLLNCTKPPFDDVLARYALNMAADRMRTQGECERHMLRGLPPNLLDIRLFKYAS